MRSEIVKASFSTMTRMLAVESVEMPVRRELRTALS
jgi:hypothetical protein